MPLNRKSHRPHECWLEGSGTHESCRAPGSSSIVRIRITQLQWPLLPFPLTISTEQIVTRFPTEGAYVEAHCRFFFFFFYSLSFSFSQLSLSLFVRIVWFLFYLFLSYFDVNSALRLFIHRLLSLFFFFFYLFFFSIPLLSSINASLPFPFFRISPLLISERDIKKKKTKKKCIVISSSPLDPKAKIRAKHSRDIEEHKSGKPKQTPLAREMATPYTTSQKGKRS